MTNVNVFIPPGATFAEACPVVKKSLIARRLEKIQSSGVRRMFSIVQQIPDAISLGIGEPDFSPPLHVIDAAKEALDRGKTHYTPSAGIQRLRDAIAKKARREYGLEYDSNEEVLVTIGATQAVFLSLMTIINPGDEVLLFDPGFVCYAPDVVIAGGTPVGTPLRERDGYKIDLDTVMSHITDKTRAIIINSPNNPTGAVFSYEDLHKLTKFLVERDIIVISDEVYEKIVYDDAKHFCLASFPGMKDRTIVVNSFSKTYAMTGFRVGYALGPKELIRQMLKIHQYTVACVDSAAQYAAVAALEGPQELVKTMVTEFDRRRRLMYKRVNEIEGFSCVLPKGAFYVFANVKELNMQSVNVADFLAKEARVITVAGSAFGTNGEGYLRLSYATSYEKIEEAMDRIEKAVKKLR
ncbi:MAG: pyridoxal phosphate-dependent aminotransferase [Candidatus Bathyarchaeia archaeon]